MSLVVLMKDMVMTTNKENMIILENEFKEIKYEPVHIFQKKDIF